MDFPGTQRLLFRWQRSLRRRCSRSAAAGKTSARYGARLSSVSSIRVQNGAVEITLSQANNRFPALLDIPIPSKSSAGSAVPIGTGPYVYTTGDNGASLMKNTVWWKGESLPVDTIPLRTVDSENTLTYLFSSTPFRCCLLTTLAATQSAIKAICP